MSDDTIYRSSHPDVIAAWDRQNDEWHAYQERRDAQMKAWGFEKHPIYVSRSPFGERVAGIARNGRETAPDGWRRERGKDYFVPARTTKAGKKIAKEFDELAQIPNARKVLEPFGMPSWIFVSLRVTAYEASLVGRVLWVRWRSADPEDTATVDHAYWERVSLSAFYLMVEDGRSPFAADGAA